MIIEQIRYYIREEDRDSVLRARREVVRIRTQAGVPAGQILVADDGPEGGPTLIWQCGYANEGEMGMAEAALIGHAEYEAAREELGTLVIRVELELYMGDVENEG